jgi:hypothetical protein
MLSEPSVSRDGTHAQKRKSLPPARSFKTTAEEVDKVGDIDMNDELILRRLPSPVIVKSDGTVGEGLVGQGDPRPDDTPSQVTDNPEEVTSSAGGALKEEEEDDEEEDEDSSRPEGIISSAAGTFKVEEDQDDDSSIEDVTEEMVARRQREQTAAAAARRKGDKKAKNKKIASHQKIIRSRNKDSHRKVKVEEASTEDDTEDDEEEDIVDYSDDEEDVESSDATESEDEESDGDYKPAAVEVSPRKRKREPRKAPLPPLEVLMDEKDVPMAPGKPHAVEKGTMQEMATLDASNAKDADQVVKDRIVKLLNTGFHESSNEHEAKNAMKLAQKLMKRHNLSQALLLQERDAKQEDDDQVLKGGMVTVRILNRKTRQPAQLQRWISELMHPISENFSVKSYYQRSQGYSSSVTFYGIYTNSQLAAYAFRVATENISQMMTEYIPTKRTYGAQVSTRTSRLSYALGIVRGIGKEVDAHLRREEREREEKLTRARQAVSKGEAYQESDDEGNGDDGPGYAFPVASNGKTENDDAEKDGMNRDAKPSGNGTGVPPATASGSPEAGQGLPGRISLSGEALQHRVEEMEKQNDAELVLADHSEKIAEEVLKDKGLKLHKGSKRKPITIDGRSYRRGEEDSKEIDINQRAIRDGVRVKKEKT